MGQGMTVKNVLGGLLGISLLLLWVWWTRPEPIPLESVNQAAEQSEAVATEELLSASPLASDTRINAVPNGGELNAAEASEAMRVADHIKTQVVKYYSNEGAWPNSNDVLDLPTPPHYKTNVLNRVDVMDDGEVVITLEKGRSNRGEIHLIPRVNPASGDIQWQCESFDFSNIAELAAPCVFRGTQR
jgi:hypothetical protein